MGIWEKHGRCPCCWQGWSWMSSAPVLGTALLPWHCHLPPCSQAEPNVKGVSAQQVVYPQLQTEPKGTGQVQFSHLRVAPAPPHPKQDSWENAQPG